MKHFAKSTVCGVKTEKDSESEKGTEVSEVQGVENEVGALFLGKVGTGQHQNQSKKHEVTITASETNRKIKMEIDTGADVTVIGLNHLHIFGTSKEKLKQPNRKLVGPDKHKFKCHGCFTATLKCGSKEMIEVIYVCDYIDIPLLGQPGIDNLELITLKSNINVVKENEPQEDNNYEHCE